MVVYLEAALVLLRGGTMDTHKKLIGKFQGKVTGNDTEKGRRTQIDLLLPDAEVVGNDGDKAIIRFKCEGEEAIGRVIEVDVNVHRSKHD
jgi:hypothetical protein